MLVWLDKNNDLTFDEKDKLSEVEVSEQTYDELHICKRFHKWHYEDGNWNMVPEDLDSYLRLKRNTDCFRLIDQKSSLWFNHLSEERKVELNSWYEAWLKVTETKVIPDKPEWLN